MPWNRGFDDRGAATYRQATRDPRRGRALIQRLPKAEQQLPHWQLAVEALINCAEGRDFLMHARIAALRALTMGNRGRL